MSQVVPIANNLTPAIFATIVTNVAAGHTIADAIKIALNQAQKKGLIKVGPMRRSEIASIHSQLMVPYPKTIPSTFTLTEFETLLQEETDSENAAFLCYALYIIYKDHGEIIRNNLMVNSIDCLDNARLLAKSNTGIDNAVKDITSKYLSGFTGTKGETGYSIGASAIINMNKVKSQKMFTNLGNTVLAVLQTNGQPIDTLLVSPGTGVLIPKKWTSVVVTNQSATDVGGFSVYQNS